MKQLTEHFTQEELGVAGCEERLVDNAEFMARMILEPIHKRFGAVHVNCGYRDDEHNKRVGGKPTSYHLFKDGRAASDIHVHGCTLVELFDWIRLESKISFDKVILEYSKGQPTVVHIQVDRLNPPRRLAFTGGTGNCQHYEPVEVR